MNFSVQLPPGCTSGAVTLAVFIVAGMAIYNKWSSEAVLIMIALGVGGINLVGKSASRELPNAALPFLPGRKKLDLKNGNADDKLEGN